jgi:dihydroxyacetone kinase-like protein
MNTLNRDQVVAILTTLTHEMQTKKDYLIELDSAIGDGDLGITVDRGFQGVRDGLQTPAADIGRILSKAGMDFSNSAGSTMGALLGTAFMRAGKQVQGQMEISLADLARMVKAGEDGIIERGKAHVGDKTVLDAIVPARQALEQAAQDGSGLTESLQKALAAAEEGMRSTVPMQAVFGRARWLGERSIGHQDPGATLIVLMLTSIVQSVSKLDAAG